MQALSRASSRETSSSGGPARMSAAAAWTNRRPSLPPQAEAEILERLKRGITSFRLLFRGSRSRSEVVATFLAVLELCKARRLLLAGTESDCTVTCTQEEGAVEFTSEND